MHPRNNRASISHGILTFQRSHSNTVSVTDSLTVAHTSVIYTNLRQFYK